MTASPPAAGRSPSGAKLGLNALRSSEELRLAGRVSGVLYLAAAVTAPALLLPGPTRVTTWVLIAEATVAAVWGAACLLVLPWEKVPWWVSHASSFAGLLMASALMAGTGGTQSAARLYLLFVVVFAAYFYPWREACALVLGCGAALALPLLYQSDAVHKGILRELAIGIPAYVVAGGAIIGGRLVAERLRERAERLGAERESVLAEHASLRRVATAVASSAPPSAVFALVASEAVRLFGADGAAILRYDGDEVELVGTCSPENQVPTGTRFALRPELELSVVRQTGRTARTDGYPPGTPHPAPALGYQCCVCAPIRVDERLWGAISLVDYRAFGLPADAEERLLEYAHLLASSIANTERQTELIRRSSVDALTGLANHRTFHERVESEVARALRHQRPLSLVLVDMDSFKQINEQIGHGASDRLLAEVGRILQSATRKSDMVARLGADEFGLLLPETDKRTAFLVLERARITTRRRHVAGFGPLTFTAGICDLSSAGGEGSLYRLADAALHWGKSRGRDVCWLYDATIVRDPAREPAVDDPERSHALAALQALSRAIDAKDPLTAAHSERVAALATRLALACGWEAERVELLENAALVHDVGKIGVPDAILLKPAALEPAEYEVIKQHAALGAQIVHGVLTCEQVEWVRSHHERPDGRGYPNGVLGPSLSEGSALLAMADAFDAMTSARSYGRRKELQSAVTECRALAGRQFTLRAVEALEAVYQNGLLAAA